MRKKLAISVLSFVTLAAAVVAQVLGGHAAFAAGPATGGNCAPYQNYTYYWNNNCIFQESPPMSQASGSFMYVSVYMEPSASQYGILNSAIDNAVQNWSYTSHVKMTHVGSPCGGTNCVLVYAQTNNGDCHGVGDSGPTPKTLTLYINPSATCSLSGWTGLSAHEIGHTMGLAHNVYMYNGNFTTCAGATYSMLMLGGCYIKVSQPQPSDFSALNSIYPGDPNDCSWAASNWNCNNEDYIQEGCNAYPQSAQTKTDGIITIKLYYSTNCTSNWVWATLGSSSGWHISKETIERASNQYDGPDFMLQEFPGGTSWYTNMLYAPNASAQGCAYYNNGSSYRSLCTGWS
ncbi:MAG TPA: hypothetical protein VGR57_18430 [Ktedonobacterales bacterium]|nr:hypothetical protein [Ktedonobacterales bacterium]